MDSRIHASTRIYRKFADGYGGRELFRWYGMGADIRGLVAKLVSSQASSVSPAILSAHFSLASLSPLSLKLESGWFRSSLKWHHTHPLHVSASTTSAQSAPSSPFTSITLPGLASPSRSDAGSSSASITESDSTILKKSPTNPASTATIQSTPSFATGIAMLLYNVAYLAYTQHVNIPLHQVAAGDVLGNLWTTFTRNHLIPHSSSFPLAHLPPPTPHGFRLEFGQLLQAASRPRDTASSQDRSSSHTRARTTSDTHSQTRPGRSGKDRRRVSEVSLAKDIVKMRGDHDLSQVFEDEEGRERSHEGEEDEWDIL
ncbi:hypothetical protein BT96DRAFT_1019298 [Gymnopus androsaceus JB14]|uniref:Autophagy-related protein 14 n=1 Tax=Gymnopus androsaceus JB14 TaxID=1447944 RepID=A0A6A4HQ22_9AGAR|nr:hypothetical protein BT96DRAFT_1019298 [Gymnopus androsaceus JB14]